MTGIPIAINILLIILFIIAGFIEKRRLFAKYPNLQLEEVLKKAPYLYVLIPLSVILLIVAFLNDPSFIWNLPLWLQYHYLSMTWGGILSIFVFIFSLTSFICLNIRHREKWKIVIASMLLVGAIQVVQWSYTRRIAPSLEDNILPSGLVMQTSGTSCAAASAASIVRQFGMQKTEREMAELFKTTIGGTSAAHVIYGMQKIGISCKKVEIKNSNPEILKSPAMIFIDHPAAGDESHAVAYMGINKGKAEIWDPLEGKRFLDVSQLKEIWHGRGIEFTADNKS